MFSERENSKRLLNEYLTNSLVLPVDKSNPNSQNKIQNIKIEEDIESRININPNVKQNNPYLRPEKEVENTNKIEPLQNNENQMNQNDIREYAMNLPIRGKKLFIALKFLILFYIISKRTRRKCQEKNKF